MDTNSQLEGKKSISTLPVEQNTVKKGVPDSESDLLMCSGAVLSVREKLKKSAQFWILSFYRNANSVRTTRHDAIY